MNNSSGGGSHVLGRWRVTKRFEFHACRFDSRGYHYQLQASAFLTASLVIVTVPLRYRVCGVIIKFSQVIGWVSQLCQHQTLADGHLKLSRSVVPISMFHCNSLYTFLTRVFLFFLSFSRVKGTCRSRTVLRVARCSIKQPSPDVHKHKIGTVFTTPTGFEETPRYFNALVLFSDHYCHTVDRAS